VSWEQELFEPIELEDGQELVTLRDAGHFIQELPKAAQERPEWQAAVRALLLVVECNGDTLLAYIGMMRALRADKPGPEPTPRRKRAKKVQNNPMNRIARVT
jgi:hypothetical protein